MNHLEWYVYQNGQQLGPFDKDKILSLLNDKMILDTAYLFKAGWKDWRPVEDTFEELGVDAGSDLPAQERVNRRAAAPRASIAGRVIVHNNGQLVIGSGVNISRTGIFVETTEQIFTLGENLKLTVKCDGLGRPFNAVAEIIRFNSDPRFPIGYGMRFIDLDNRIIESVGQLVEAENRKRAVGD